MIKQKLHTLRPAKFLMWVKSSRKHQIIATAVIVVLVLLGAALTLTFTKDSKDTAVNTENSAQSEQKRTVSIDSNVPGIVMSVTQKCEDDSSELKTPGSCTVGSDQSEITVVAPSHSVIEGKTYLFKSWDGCSASNEDWKICKVTFDEEDSKKLMANYLPSSDFRSSTGSAPNTPQSGATADGTQSKNLREQCESSKVSSAQNNSVRCTVASTALFLGFDWSNNPEPSPQPPVTVKCLESNQVDCKLSSAGTGSVVIQRGASLAVNSSSNIGGQNPGPQPPSHTISAASGGSAVTVTLSAPLSFGAGGSTYKFVDYSIYVPGYQRAGTSSDYFNWVYKL